MMTTSPARYLTGCAVVALLALGSCSDSGSAPTPAQQLGLISPRPGATVPADRLQIELDALDLNTVRATNRSAADATVSGTASAERIWLLDLPLVPGDNEVLLSARRGNALIELTLSVTSTASGTPLRVTASPRELEGTPAETRLAIEVTSTATFEGQAQVLFDAEGNGEFVDGGSLNGSVGATYFAEGTYKPRVLVRNSDNVLLASDPLRTEPVRVVAPTVIDPSAAITVGDEPVDMARLLGSDDVFVLSRVAAQIDRLDPTGTLVRSFSLSGLQSPSGCALDPDGNLFVVDGGANRVFRFLAPNFTPDQLVSPDGGFGAAGDGPGQFADPTDCAVQGEGSDLRLFVADTGNDRIQVFNRLGVYETEFDGTAGGGARLSQPRGLCAVQGGGIAVLDANGTTLRILDRRGRTTRSGGSFNGATRVTCAPRINGYCVADPAGSAVVLLSANCQPRRRIAGFNTVAATPRSLPNGFQYLLSAGGTAPRCDVAPIAVDPTADAPERIVERFLAFVAAGDFTGARQFVHTERRADYDQLLTDAAEAARITASASLIQGLVHTDLGADFALVAGELTPAGGTPEPVEFTLERSADTGRWALAEF